MAFFDELKKNLSGVTDTVAKTSESVMKKSSTAIEIQKAKLKKVSLEGDMKSLYESLGQLYFEKYADGDMPKEMAELAKKIRDEFPEAKHFWEGEMDATLSTYIGSGVLGACIQFLD